MSLADDLLLQAMHLARLDEGVPGQANLRRAVSSAYYGLFHLLTGEASQVLSSRGPALLAPRVARAFSHGEMRQLCNTLSSGSIPKVLKQLQPSDFSADLLLVASTFVDLQDERHRADYDLSTLFDRSGTLNYVDSAEEAFLSWRTVRDSDEANVFLTALLLNSRWSK